ncbi:MAG: LysE family translocator [Alphaproteobacteria bacterium]
MDSLPLVLKGFLVGILVAAPMGPVNVLCIQKAVTRGRVAGFLTGLGAAFGDAVFAVVAALGLTAVAAFIDKHEIWFRLPGGLLLLVLAVLLWRSHPHFESGSDDNNGASTGLFRSMTATFLLTVSNPITLAGFATLFVAWGLSTGFDAVAAANVVLGVFAGSAFWWAALALLVGLLHGHIEDKHLLLFNRIAAVGVVCFGIYAIDSVTLELMG